MRPTYYLLIILTFLAVADLALYLHNRHGQARFDSQARLFDTATAALGLSDLCIATEARYTRHPAASDPVVPFMDHPGAIEHFPSGSFWAPPGKR